PSPLLSGAQLSCWAPGFPSRRASILLRLPPPWTSLGENRGFSVTPDSDTRRNSGRRAPLAGAPLAGPPGPGRVPWRKANHEATFHRRESIPRPCRNEPFTPAVRPCVASGARRLRKGRSSASAARGGGPRGARRRDRVGGRGGASGRGRL